ncbi:MAG TPA: hypothetical protein VFA98_01770, partial [Thermoanaerobaculia bacterium]|nr:hypothetical protein [Thermoanaerobaculia bacterium]
VPRDVPDRHRDSMSAFAVMLRKLFDDTKLFGRAEWANVLNVPEEKIARWLRDCEFPRPESLRRVLRVVEEDVRFHQASGFVNGGRTSERIVREFRAFAQRPLSEVAAPLEWPCSQPPRWDYTTEKYMTIPAREAFLDLLDTLDPSAQEEILQRACALVREAQK